MTTAAEALVRDCANRLDQLFRQDYTMGDVEAELRRLLRATQSNGHSPENPATGRLQHRPDVASASLSKPGSARCGATGGQIDGESPAPRLIVTRGDGVPLPDQAAAIEAFKEQARRKPPAQQAQPVAWRKDLNPPHGNWTLIWQAANPWPGQFHVSALYAAPPQDSARELLREASDELDYQTGNDHPLVERIRAFLKDRT